MYIYPLDVSNDYCVIPYKQLSEGVKIRGESHERGSFNDEVSNTKIILSRNWMRWLLSEHLKCLYMKRSWFALKALFRHSHDSGKPSTRYAWQTSLRQTATLIELIWFLKLSPKETCPIIKTKVINCHQCWTTKIKAELQVSMRIGVCKTKPALEGTNP
jgi:hypothetical protein